MDEIIVGIIVAGAIIFTVKNAVNTYQGKRSCDCGSGCSCASKDSCPQALQRTNKRIEG
ncbi:FeoB-associated Cys-rich membrane protein [Desulfobacula sp.]|uniref:FeoB-associated Cys-rich membrane protein n=1 Tax=Desulfobacula sp. TaxID=2593537 RepID=UPI0026392C0A|nr:FeoB-associated Cys-rich membrane protein [Desulfobacula sp.]